MRSPILRLPGMRPHAPKRNAIVVLAYLYALVLCAWLLAGVLSG